MKHRKDLQQHLKQCRIQSNKFSSLGASVNKGGKISQIGGTQKLNDMNKKETIKKLKYAKLNKPNDRFGFTHLSGNFSTDNTAVGHSDSHNIKATARICNTFAF